MKFIFLSFASALVMWLATSCGKKPVMAESDSGAPAFDSPWSCEEHWMVDLAARELSGLAMRAGAAAEVSAVEATDKGGVYQIHGAEIRLAPSCWDLASYMPLAAGWHVHGQPAGPLDGKWAERLLEPDTATLQAVNAEVSKRLSEHPADAASHEAAAMLLGTFGLRENARAFSDLRPLLCRMTAHLVMAENLRGTDKPTATGEIALALYDLHAGRPMAALQRAEGWQGDAVTAIWSRAIRLFITGDWRVNQERADETLLESIARARALHIHVGNERFLEMLESRKKLQECSEWTRILCSRGKSVQEGHLAMKAALGMEIADIHAVFPIQGEPTPKKLGKLIGGREPRGEDAARVIRNVDWAAYFRRHFFAAAADIERFALVQWAEPNAAAEWATNVLPFCRELSACELVEPLLATKAPDYRKDMATTAESIRHHPELVPMALWHDYRFPALNISSGVELPPQVAWFRAVSPPGTAHDPVNRIRFDGIKNDWNKALTDLHAIDPWNHELCSEITENSPITPDSIQKVWGGIPDYSAIPLRMSLLSTTIPIEQRIETLRKLAAINPEAGCDLGEALVIHHQPEEAIKAYEAAFEKTSNRVAISNDCQWMIHHYKQTGNDKRAREVAAMLEEVYSSRGLQSAMSLAIVEKDAERAMTLAKKIDERYNDPVFRAVAGWFAKGNEADLKRVFPNGLIEVKSTDFEPRKPHKGVRFTETSVPMLLNGLRCHDILLAVDGKRVETFQQYIMLMASGLDPNVKMIVKRGPKILDLDCILPKRRCDATMVSQP